MQKIIRALSGPVQAKINIPGSKNITQRALLIAALANGVSEISGLYINQSTRIFVRALHQLGIVTQLDEKTQSCIIAGGNGKVPKTQATLWCQHVGIMTHFLIAACATSTGVYYFDGPSALYAKTLPLLDILYRHNVQLIPSEQRQLPFTLMGADGLEGSEIILHSAFQHQLISTLLLIAPYARSPFTFTATSTEFSHYQSHVDMTCSVMADFGVLVHRIHQGQWLVPIPQRYQPKDYIIEPDFNFAIYFFAACAINGGHLTIQPTKRNQSKQANSKFLSMLEKMGCKILETHTGLTVKSEQPLQGLEVSLRDFSDIFLALCIIAPFATTPTRIMHATAPTQKELARFTALKNSLIQIGVQVESGQHWLKIYPCTSPSSLKGIVSTSTDYKIAMALSILGLKIPQMVIENSDCILKRYPLFFTYLEQIVNAEVKLQI